MEKRCSKCKKLKNINEFHKNNTKKDGLSCHCAYCVNKRNRDYYYKNKNKIKHSHKLYKEKNKDEYKEMHRIADRKWYYKNRDKKISSTKEWKEKNKKQQKEYRKIYSAKFRKIPKNKLRSNVTRMINSRIKKNGMSMLDFLPYTIDELKTHLQSKFQAEMTWENYGKWHIDHIKPDSLFNYNSMEDKEFQECWALSNLQPLWAIDNLIKSNKYDEQIK